MLNDGFEMEMRVILKLLPKRKQTMLFSATRTDRTDKLANLALKLSLIEVDVDADDVQSTVSQLKECEYLLLLVLTFQSHMIESIHFRSFLY